MNWLDLLPLPASDVITWCRQTAARLRHDDTGEIGIIGAIILVAGFAVAAGLLVTAIDGKLNSWISKIPG